MLPTMSDSVYAVIAFIARYWFVLLAVVIVWRAIKWLRKDAEHVSRAQRRLPDAGYIGEWVVVASNAPGIEAGFVLPAARDGWIGSARGCDVRLQNAGVPAKAARFFFRPDGLHMQPQRSDSLLVDGEPVHREAVLRHGATLTTGGVTLQLRLFAGILLEGEALVPRKARRRRNTAPEMETDDLPEPILPEDEDEADVYEAYETDAYDEPYYDEAEQANYPQDANDSNTLPPVELPKPSLTIRTRRSRRP